MKPHDRIMAVLNRQPVDRVPVDIWLTPEVLASLREYVGVSEEYEVYTRLGVDKIAWIFPGYDSDRYDPNLSAGRDAWGVPTVEVKSGLATYHEFGAGPLAEMEEVDELDDYPFWPDPGGFCLAASKRHAQHAREYGFATIGPWVSHFEIYCHLRGMELALMDLVADPELLHAALDRIDQIQTTMLDRFLSELGELIDIVFISDDMGTQFGQLISTESWQRFFQPRLARWCDLVHSHRKTVLFHTDGAVRGLIPHLIDSGVDVLNPIQHVCTGMDRLGLKRDFGQKLVFHGGIENQYVLPQGSPQEVREEVRTCLRTLGEGGAYIPCSCHNIQAGTPVENVIAMIETVQEWQA